ncbi:MAG TPA: glycosyltransferase [Bacillota bacterium]|nr:glycosyltransferase [Bacillota bacterium]
MVTISLCMIVKNEALTLGECLESVKDIADEIIIVDTGSTDQTKEIAKRYTDKIYDFEWIDDFSAARNYSFSKATKDYILWLDADDRIRDEDQKAFLQLKQTLEPDVDVVMMPYQTGLDCSGRPALTYYRERLLRRNAHFRWQEPVHEYIQPSGKIIHAPVKITHCKLNHGVSRRNLEIYQKQLNAGKTLSSRSLLYYGMELYYHQEYPESAARLEQFLNEGKGWVEDNIKACFYLGKIYNVLGDFEKSLQSFLASFRYDLPRAEHCCEIGYLYKARKDYQRALFWFDLASRLNQPKENWGFYFNDYWGYIPNIELSVIHYWLGDLEKAIEYNERAAAVKPEDKSILFNRKFYEIEKFRQQSINRKRS